MVSFNEGEYKDFSDFLNVMCDELSEKLVNNTLRLKQKVFDTTYYDALVREIIPASTDFSIVVETASEKKTLSGVFMILNDFADPDSFDFSEYKALLREAREIDRLRECDDYRQRLEACQAKREEQKKISRAKAYSEKVELHKKRVLASIDDFAENARTSVSSSFFVALGYVARHAKKVSAVLPDYLEPWFISQFGESAEYRVVSSEKRTSGGFAMQWSLGMSITLDTNDGLPDFLSDKLADVEKEPRAITDTKFVFDLVRNYGFMLRKKQSLEQISDHVPANEMEAFTFGYNL